jgi:type I restriction-modification system DNA methylase subunit
MKKRNVSDLHHGREVWKDLEQVSYGRSAERVFEDWLDLMLAAYLSVTDNLSRPDFEEKLKANKLDGTYEDRYMEIAKRYADDHPKSKRAIDYFAAATRELVKATTESGTDVLGEIYMAMITFGQHGQFFTPQHISTAIVKMLGVEDGESVNDPACGSGTMLIEAGKQNPNALITGCDLDHRCAKMAALNMYIFDLNATIYWGNTLTMEFYTEWRIGKGGFMWEREIPKQERETAPAKKSGQQELFAA